MTSPSAAPRRRGTTQGVPLRPIFRAALRDMLLLVGSLAVLGTVVGGVVAHGPGVWGALLGVGVALLFSGTTVVTMLLTAESTPTTMAAVVMGAWLGKMALLVVLLTVLGDRTFYSSAVFAVVLLVGAIGSAVLDYLAVRRARVPYVEPTPGGSSLES